MATNKVTKGKRDPKLDECFCKLKIDKKTVIYCRTEESYLDWLVKYPKASQVGFNAEEVTV